MIPLNYIDTPEMISISADWLHGPRLASIAALKPLLPAVEAAHADLVRAQPAAPAATSADVAALSATERVLDVRHDHVVRAIWHASVALEEYLLSLDPPNDDDAQAVAQARDRLLPAGLGTTQATYLAEEGYAKQARDLVDGDADLASTLGRVVVTKKVTGSDLLASWVELGSKLGDAERDKSKTLAAEAASPAAAATGTERKARSRWMAVAETVLSVLGHVQGDAADAIRRSVTEPAERAAKKARAARRAAKAAKAADATPKDG
jgi:hypothetical protein